MAAWTDELEQLNTDVRGTFGRVAAVFSDPVGAAGTLTGTDGTFFQSTGSVTVVFHEEHGGARSGGAGGGGVRTRSRVFRILLADLAVVCASTDGVPAAGRFVIADPVSDDTTEYWWAERVELDGDRTNALITASRGGAARLLEGA